MRQSKYDALTQYLLEFPDDICTLRFDEIETIIGCKLPESAFSHSEVWWNNANQHSAFFWLRAGYIVSQYNIYRKFAVFTRDKDRAKEYISRCGKKASDQRTYLQLTRKSGYTPKVSVSTLIEKSEIYVDEIQRDEHCRYLSWEHCYKYFQQSRHNPTAEQLDLMCLHLAWYLASWGMLRGGAFLLQKDYLVHMPVVKLLVSEEYSDLYGLSAQDMAGQVAIKKICKLADEITEIYRNETSDDDDGERIASDTLITKILLGTMGCAPAYDRYFKQGLSISGVAQQKFGERSLLQLTEYYVKNLAEFEQYRRKVSAGRVEYTPMKIIDMCFWQLGYDNEKIDNRTYVG